MMWHHNSKVMHLMWHHNSKMMYLMWHPIITRNIWCHFRMGHHLSTLVSFQIHNQLVPSMVSVEKVTLCCSDTLCLWWLVINVTIYLFPCSVTKWGIEVNPNKIWVVQELTSLKPMKEMSSIKAYWLGDKEGKFPYVIKGGLHFLHYSSQSFHPFVSFIFSTPNLEGGCNFIFMMNSFFYLSPCKFPS